MSRDRTIEVEGTVIELLPNAIFQVRMPNGHVVLAHCAPEEKTSIRLLPGDKVMLEMTPYDMSKGRILFRQK